MDQSGKRKNSQKNRKRNRNKRLESLYSCVEPVSLLPVPEYPLPKELLDLLKQNLRHYPGISEKGEKWLKFLDIVQHMKEVKEEDYVIILKLLLYLEEYYNNVSMQQYNLNKWRIKRAQYSSGGFVIRVPGLSEDRPSLLPNDIIDLYQWNRPEKYSLTVNFIGENYIVARPSTNHFYNAFKEDAKYNIKFRWPNWPVRVCHYAISLVHDYKLTSLLFPQPRTVYNRPKKDLVWFDKNIKSNPEQMQAVERIVGKTAHPSPYLLFGPPGTGKTSTVVEAISQIFVSSQNDRILVCTPSNAAADEVTKRLLNNVPSNLVFRMFSPSRDAKDVDESIKECTNFIDDEVIFLPRDLLIKKRIVITTLVTCMRLVSMKLWESHFDYIFIDEAGQATQPESLIPIGLTSGEDLGHVGRFHAQIVLSGDPQQLGPVIMTKIGHCLLGKSMLERFMDSFEIYKKCQEGKYDPNFITKLVQNYRSHEAILRIPNELFYDSELEICGGHKIHRAENWSELPNKKFPIIFHATHGLEKRHESSPSVCNESEVKIVMNYVEKILDKTMGDGKIKQKDIGIVTPFRLQRTVILRALEKKGWSDIAVGTVEIFQGQEKDVIILSSVRSTVFRNDNRFHIGFLSHKKRFNVAITRAKALLIVVGNPMILQIDHCWKRFIDYCHLNGAIVGDEFHLREMNDQECEKLLNNRDPTKYREVEAESLPIDESEILEERIHPLPENVTPQRRMRSPITESQEIVNSSVITIHGSPEADSGTYSSSNSGTIEEQLSAPNEFAEEILDNRTISTDPNKISLDSDSNSSYYDFSSDNDDEVFKLAKNVQEIKINTAG